GGISLMPIVERRIFNQAEELSDAYAELAYLLISSLEYTATPTQLSNGRGELMEKVRLSFVASQYPTLDALRRNAQAKLAQKRQNGWKNHFDELDSVFSQDDILNQ
ncbi:MAG TPA: hypothetical protein VF209_05125, partial [Patescibacteria group bacterium]